MGSSAFGNVVTQWIGNHIQILHAEEYHGPDYYEMLSVVYGLMSRCDIDKVYIVVAFRQIDSLCRFHNF